MFWGCAGHWDFVSGDRRRDRWGLYLRLPRRLDDEFRGFLKV
jgi:hypothetical protein